jgi:choline-sulfatase
MQIDYDDEVEYKGAQCLYDLARSPSDKPFFLTVSYTHPHPPFVAPQRFWDLYREEDIDAPRVPPIPYEALDVHSQWLYVAHAQDLYSVSEAQVRRARHAYYGMVSYVDEKIGRILNVLEETGLQDNTVVVFCADHGEMLGERGMWFKQCFFESSVRVPLIVSMPKRFAPARVSEHVSLVDLLPTLRDLAHEGQPPPAVGPLHGRSLLGLLQGAAEPERCVVSEYSSEGVMAPSRMVRMGPWKYIFTHGLAPLLFNLDNDPDELDNLAGQTAHTQTEQSLHARLVQDWDPPTVHAQILASQQERLFLAEIASQSEAKPNWAYQPFVDESQRFIRGSGAAGPTSVKARARFPFVEPAQPDQAPAG